MFCVILSMYGGGFATVPAYLSDVFGTVRGRHPWPSAHRLVHRGVLGPLLVVYISQTAMAPRRPAAPC